jgi:hypothetical protein
MDIDTAFLFADLPQKQKIYVEISEDLFVSGMIPLFTLSRI